ncbi:hypothetical protein B1808_12635 [Pseudofulvimonas gallinarii]|nr:DUF998 domain-containing protein [Pseudofulvimonas gallinarii]THD12506.1 hypothetical protein B1808_12635 [Pseudofulvimonas gallinarii]
MLLSGSSKPCGDAGGVHSIIQADAASRRGLIQALCGTGTAPQMMSQKKIGLVAIATPLWFLTVYLAMSAMRPDYAHTDQAISELGSLDAPNLWAWNVLGYILPGFAVALLGIGLRREFMGRGLRANGPAMALVAAGLLMALSGAFPANMADFKSTTTLLHTVGSFGCYIAFLVAGFWLPSLFRKVNSWRWAATPSLALVIASIFTGFLRFAGMASIGQRITFLCFFLWVGLVGWALWRASSSSAPHNNSSKPKPLRGSA